MAQHLPLCMNVLAKKILFELLKVQLAAQHLRRHVCSERRVGVRHECVYQLLVAHSITLYEAEGRILYIGSKRKRLLK